MLASQLFPTESQPIVQLEFARNAEHVIRKIRIHEKTWESTRIIPPTQCDSLDPESTWWLDYLRGNREMHESHRGQIGVMDLFCGAGGLSLGAQLAANALGFDVSCELAVDIDQDALGVHARNHYPRYSERSSVADLVKYKINEDRNGARYEVKPQMPSMRHEKLKGSVDLLLAGPPCQGHSTFNNHTRFHDPRNLLYLAVPAVAVALDVPSIVIENVPGVTASREGVVSTTMELLVSSGYKVTSRVLDASKMGWPQNRRRFFLVATRDWDPIELDAVESGLRSETRSIGWALQDVLESGEQSFMTESPVLSSENLRRIDYLHDMDVQNLPDSERPDCHKDGHTYPSVYGRLWWDRPAPTITTGFMTPGRGRYVHPIERRTLLAREAARIQGFPDSYVFESSGQKLSRASLTRGIGDAVPAPMGFAAVLSALASKN